MSPRALVADPTHPDTMRWDVVAEPDSGPHELVLEVRHASLNHGDLNDAVSGRIPPGDVLGSDIAGIVSRPARDGSGPEEGVRVVALARGGFAERVAVNVESVAVVPDGLDLASAAALPVAGLAALRTIRSGGSLLGRRVLVTGASGGVGSFAIQLAAASGAHVIASVGHPERARGLTALGAREVVIGLEGIDEPVDLVIDGVGGPTLVRAWHLLAPGGTLQSVGWASAQPATFQPYATVGPAKTLASYLTEGPAGEDLGTLARLALGGLLSVRIGWQGSWDRVTEAADALRGRRLDGKAILDVGPAADGAARID